MKKILVFCIILLNIVKVNSQDYLISFAGTGASTTIDSIKVENITQDTSITIPGGTQLGLKKDVVLNSIIRNYQAPALQIYPNPA
jgi:hypothetical protein